ncbi:uncharacterized protein LOC134551477 [Prinia subflava]|uniref:uncharacterized protein LOC134551477 n=1 Tax=Prinia subflava TaxID=208062 RepID=UPI002FE0D6B4
MPRAPLPEAAPGTRAATQPAGPPWAPRCDSGTRRRGPSRGGARGRRRGRYLAEREEPVGRQPDGGGGGAERAQLQAGAAHRQLPARRAVLAAPQRDRHAGGRAEAPLLRHAGQAGPGPPGLPREEPEPSGALRAVPRRAAPCRARPGRRAMLPLGRLAWLHHAGRLSLIPMTSAVPAGLQRSLKGHEKARGISESPPRSLLCLEEWLVAAIHGKSCAVCPGSHCDTRDQVERWAGALKGKVSLAGGENRNSRQGTAEMEKKILKIRRG